MALLGIHLCLGRHTQSLCVSACAPAHDRKLSLELYKHFPAHHRPKPSQASRIISRFTSLHVPFEVPLLSPDDFAALPFLSGPRMTTEATHHDAAGSMLVVAEVALAGRAREVPGKGMPVVISTGLGHSNAVRCAWTDWGGWDATS
eukprot:3835773-Rhodomonas_salina.1